MTERHVVANGDLPPDGVLVLAYWDEPKWPETEQWEVAKCVIDSDGDEDWQCFHYGGWDGVWPPAYWWALPEYVD